MSSTNVRPTKHEITTILNKLKSIPTNKTDSSVVEEFDFFNEQCYADVDKIAKVSGITSMKTANSDPLPPANGPNIDFRLSNENQPTDMKQLTNKKPLAKSRANKGGLGAAKVKTDFAAIELAAKNADLQKEQQEVLAKNAAQEKAERATEKMASARLAYKELTREEKQQPQENTLKITDPNKAAQVERLGMSSNRLGSRNINHSAFSNVDKIEQEGVKKTNADSLLISSDMDFFGTYSGDDRRHKHTSSSRNLDDNWLQSTFEVDEIHPSLPKSNAVFSENKKYSGGNSSQTYSDNNKSRSKHDRDNFNPAQKSAISEDFVKKFANATSISSDDYFNQHEDVGNDYARYQNCTSISSDDYFGRTSSRPPPSNFSYELQSIKDGVRLGVGKVTSRLSNMATGVVNNLQASYFVQNFVINGSVF